MLKSNKFKIIRITSTSNDLKILKSNLLNPDNDNFVKKPLYRLEYLLETCEISYCILNESNQYLSCIILSSIANNYQALQIQLYAILHTLSSNEQEQILETLLSYIFYNHTIYTMIYSDILLPLYFQKDEADLYFCLSKHFIKPLIIRKAVIEDHDDLLPIFNQQSELLTSIYGTFF